MRWLREVSGLHFVVISVAAATFFFLATCSHAENFTYVGRVGSQMWELDGNWNGDAGEITDKYPGQTLTADTALLNVPLAGNLTVDISGALNIQVAALSLGDTDPTPDITTITGTGGGNLIAATINSLGTVGAVNSISANLVTNGTTIGSGSTNPLTITGGITLNNGGAKTLSNASAQTLTVNSISLSSGVAAGNLTITQGATTTVMNLEGVISNGAVAPASGGTVQLTYARGIFHNKLSNTYTGSTVLGSNSPNAISTNIIYTDSPFGSGRLAFSGGNAIKTVEGAAGFGTRTLANEIQLAREARFAGSESFVLTGKIFQSNARSIINDIAGTGKTLSLTGPIYTDSGSGPTDLGRTLTLDGSGRTEVSGTIDDKDGNPAANRGRVRKSGTGRVVYMNNSVVAYGQATEVVNGTLQLGTGGTPVNLNGHSVQGNTAGGGTLEINHSGNMNFDTSLGYNLAVTHVGSGTTTFSDNSFGTGSITVSAGTLVINGGNFAGQVLTGTRDPASTTNTAVIGNLASTAVLHIGQPITGTPVTGTGTFPADAYIAEIIDGTTILSSGNLPMISGGPQNWNLTFGAGTGTGTANVIVGSSGTVGGSGVIGGSLTNSGTVAPGTSAGTLTVNAAVVLNPSSNLVMELVGNDPTVGNNINDLIDGKSDLTLDGTVDIFGSNFMSAVAGDKWRLINYSPTGTFTDNGLVLGNVPTLSPGLEFAIDTVTVGQVNLLIVAIPEPTAILFGAVVSGLTGVGYAHRRLRLRWRHASSASVTGC